MSSSNNLVFKTSELFAIKIATVVKKKCSLNKKVYFKYAILPSVYVGKVSQHPHSFDVLTEFSPVVPMRLNSELNVGDCFCVKRLKLNKFTNKETVSLNEINNLDIEFFNERFDSYKEIGV